jgi:hypothetical protein
MSLCLGGGGIIGPGVLPTVTIAKWGV